MITSVLLLAYRVQARLARLSARLGPICLVSLGLAAMLGGCTTQNAAALASHDRFEPMNRTFFKADQKLVSFASANISERYITFIPKSARDGIHNVLANLDEPVTLGNNFLQGDLGGAGRTLVRISLNTILGIGGLVDVAAKVGIPRREQDLGITMGKWGIGAGDYFFLPLLGPLTTRDLVGRIGDVFMDPLVLVNLEHGIPWYFARKSIQLIDFRARSANRLQEIERTSLDLYSTTRSLYLQHRNSQIKANDTTTPQDLPEF